jgi:hypothetical protein
MTKGIRCAFRSVLVGAVITIAAMSAAMLVGSSPAFSQQNVPATKPASSALPGTLPRPAGVAATSSNQLVANYGKLPLNFEANEGQLEDPAKFFARGFGYTLFLTGDEAVLELQKAEGGTQKAEENVPLPVVRGPRSRAKSDQPGTAKWLPLTTDNEQRTTDKVLHIRLVGANLDAAVTGAEELAGKTNYFIGNDPKKWRTNVPNYSKDKVPRRLSRRRFDLLRHTGRATGV